MLSMYDRGGIKVLSGIKSMHDDSSACVRVKGDESDGLRIDCGMKQWYIISP